MPTRLGGLGLVCPETLPDHKFQASTCVTAPLAALIAVQTSNLGDAVAQQKIRRSKVRQERRKMQDRSARALYGHLPGNLKRSVDLAQQKGSSSWLESLPLSEHGYHLSKSEFRDTICLRYSWSLD